MVPASCGSCELSDASMTRLRPTRSTSRPSCSRVAARDRRDSWTESADGLADQKSSRLMTARTRALTQPAGETGGFMKTAFSSRCSWSTTARASRSDLMISTSVSRLASVFMLLAAVVAS